MDKDLFSSRIHRIEDRRGDVEGRHGRLFHERCFDIRGHLLPAGVVDAPVRLHEHGYVLAGGIRRVAPVIHGAVVRDGCDGINAVIGQEYLYWYARDAFVGLRVVQQLCVERAVDALRRIAVDGETIHSLSAVAHPEMAIKKN